MFVPYVVRLPAAVLALVVPAATASSATPLPDAAANATIILPLSVTKLQDMDFGYVAPTTAGTAVLNPDTDSLSVTGGVTAVGGAPHCAQFVGAAQHNSTVNIKIPKQPVTLTRVGGTQTMTATNFTLQSGLSKKQLANMDSFTFRVGATLNVAAAQVEGTYVGTFDVTVQYP
jgi:hypothetical protein